MSASNVVLVAPLVIMFIIASLDYVASERQRLEATSLEEGVDLSLAIEQDMLTLVATLKSLAVSLRFSTDLEHFKLQAREALTGRPGDLLLLDEDGCDDLASGAPPLSAFAPLVDVGRLSAGRVNVSDLLGEVTGYGRRIVMSALATSPTSERRVLSFALSPAYFDTILRMESLGSPYLEAILDRSGTIVASSDRLLGAVGDKISDFAGMTGASGRMDAVGTDGSALRRFYRRSAVTGWFVLTSVSAASLHAPLMRSIWQLSGVTLILTFIALPLVVLLTRRMRNAAGVTMEAARQLAGGARVEPRATGVADTDMIQSVLAAASTKLLAHSDALRSANRELELRVAARSRELAASHALTNSILYNSPDTIEVLDHRGRVVFTNNKGYRENRSAEGAANLALSWPSIWVEDSRTSAEAALASARTGTTSRFAGQTDTESEGRQWFDVLLTPMVTPDGGFRRFLVVSRNITTLYLRDRELQEAKERAEEASKAKAEFLASMSHELRTPLNGIMGYADLLRSDRQLAVAQRFQVDRIQDAAISLLHIVNDVLDLAKIEAGEMSLRPHALRLADEIDATLSIIMPLAQAKGLELRSRLDADLPPWILGDAERLRQILLNLLGNAVKFTDAGSIDLEVRGFRDADHAACLLFEVRDTGIGIPDDVQPLLFRRFFQVDTSNERRFGGTGLGLAICRHLVTQMEGRIEVESRVGHGSVFRVSVPLWPAPAGEAMLAATEVVAEIRAHILVVEDNVLNREVVEKMLKAIGCEVDLVPSGEEAIRAVQNRPYDLVLMDEQMPGMSGSTATRAIRALEPPARDVVIIGCSANVFTHQISRFRDAGMDGFVGKPLTRSALATVLAKHLPALRGARVDASGHEPPADFAQFLSEQQIGAGLHDLLTDLRGLRSADLANDLGPTVRRAHKVISSALMLGLEGLADACRAFEDACTRGSSIDGAFERLQSAVDEALPAINDRLSERGGHRRRTSSESKRARHE